jgi:hypothetical protein
MSGPTANLPVGLLDMLGIKSGAYPNNLIENIQPTLELFELLAESNATEIVSATNNVVAGGVGLFASHTVPQGEIWLCSGFSSACTTLVAEAITLSLIKRSLAVGVGGAPTRRWTKEGNVAAAINYVASASEGFFWAGAGSYIGFMVHSVTTAGTIVVTTSGAILRCRR